jgi:hypothetical protein
MIFNTFEYKLEMLKWKNAIDRKLEQEDDMQENKKSILLTS